MHADVYHEALRLAHSWREKAAQLLSFNRRSLESGSVDEQKYHQLSKIYEAHARAADLKLRQLLADGTREIDEAGTQLQRNLARQQALQALLVSGEMDAEAVRAESQEIEQEIHESRMRISRYNALLSARGSKALGGFMDRPLDDYGTAIAAEPPQPQRSRLLSRTDHITIAVAILIILCAVGYLAYTRVFQDKISFSATLAPGAPGPLVLTCHNEGLQTLRFAVPWEVPRDADYGVDLLVRTTPGEPFRVYSAPADVWSEPSAIASAGEPVEIPPGLIREFQLNLGRLKKLEPSLEMVRVRCTNAAGERLYRFDAPVP